MQSFTLLCQVCVLTKPQSVSSNLCSTLEAVQVSHSEKDSGYLKDLSRLLRDKIQAKHRKLLEIRVQLETITSKIKQIGNDCSRRISLHHSNKHEILQAIKKEILVKLLSIELVQTWRVHYRLAASHGTFLRKEYNFKNTKPMLILQSEIASHFRPVWLNSKLDIQGTLIVSDCPIGVPSSLAPKPDASLVLEPLSSALTKHEQVPQVVFAKPVKSYTTHSLPVRKAVDFSDSINKAKAAVDEVSVLVGDRPKADTVRPWISGHEAPDTGDALVQVMKGGVFPFEHALAILKNAKQSDRSLLFKDMIGIFTVRDKREFLQTLVDTEIAATQAPMLVNSAPSLVVSVVGVFADDQLIGSLIERAAMMVSAETDGLTAARRLADGLMQQNSLQVSQTSELMQFLQTTSIASQQKWGSSTVGLNICTGLFISRVLTPLYVKRCGGSAEVSKALLRVSRGEESGDEDLREIFIRIREWMSRALEQVPETASDSFHADAVRSSSFGKSLQEYVAKYRMDEP